MKNLLLPMFVLLSSQIGLRSEETRKIVSKPLSIGALHEFGSIQNALYNASTNSALEVGTDWVDHLGAFLNKEVIIDDRLTISGGIGGVFQFRKPEIPTAGFIGSQRKGFFVGPTRAMAEYSFGDLEKPWLKLGAGNFMYKYNSDATNLGEYLFRSGAYPQYIMTGGYVIANSAAANVQGLKGSFNFGSLTGDLLLTSEVASAPLYDWSAAAIVNYKVADGLLDFGFGVNFKRLIKIKPSITNGTTAKLGPVNGYFNYQGIDYTNNTSYYNNEGSYYEGKSSEYTTIAQGLQAKNDLVNAATYTQMAVNAKAQSDAFKGTGRMVDSLMALPDSAGQRPGVNYYSSAGTLLMARASVDLKKILGIESLNSEDLKLYTEASVLGVKNYPVFYTDITKRIPIMLGFNLPTFKFLDLFAVQFEYFNSPWLNNTSQIARYNINVPFFPNGSDKLLSENSYNDGASRDNIKWSVMLKRSLGKNVSIIGQAATDHLRVVSSKYYFGPQYDHNEVTAFSNQWYWMTQIAWGI